MAQHRRGRNLALSTIALVALVAVLVSRRAPAYIEAPMSLGAILWQSSNAVLLELVEVDTERNVLQFRKVKDLKGRHHSDQVTHHIGQQGFHPREWQTVMQWAKPGKTAVFFHNGQASETCIDNYWYQCYGNGQYWRMSHAEPYLLRSYAGRPARLGQVVEQMVHGEEVVVPCMVDADKEELQLGRARLQRLRASLNRLDYNPERDFAGWGTGELEELRGMPGFSHVVTLPQVGPLAVGVSLADFDADGRLDVSLFGESRVALLRAEEKAYTEVALPSAPLSKGGARSAAWADCDGDGRLDLLLAAASGPRLLAGSAGKSPLRDASARLPRLAAPNLTCAAWIDADTDGWPDALLANGFYGLRIFLNVAADGGGQSASARGRSFRDAGEVALPAEVFEGAAPAASRGDHLACGDVDGDGRTDVFYCAGNGVLLLGAGEPGRPAFVPAPASGVVLDGRGVGPAFGDWDGDGDLDLFVPSGSCGRLYANEGRGRFEDVSARAFAPPAAANCGQSRATAAAWGDYDCDGRLDLAVACLRGPNRLFLNRGDGRLEDATRALGLERRVFNSQGIALADVDGDGDLDVALANEGQESCILLSAPGNAPGRAPLEVVLPRDPKATGALVRVLSSGAGAGGQPALVHACEPGALGGRGSQGPGRARVGLAPGAYRLEVRYPSGELHEAQVDVGASPVTVEVER